MDPKRKKQESEKVQEIEHDPPKMIAQNELKLLAENQDQRMKELEDLLKRLQADFDNFRKQIEKEKIEMRANATATFIQKLLPIIDEFEHAINSAKKSQKSEDMIKGFEMVYANLLKLLHGEGLKEMIVEKERFDPYKHEAIRYEESELDEGIITEIVKKGYCFNNKILRPASVIVSKGKKSDDEDEKHARCVECG